jgi:ubiquitin carboxyl-terminal hydrolase 4/11/15
MLGTGKIKQLFSVFLSSTSHSLLFVLFSLFSNKCKKHQQATKKFDIYTAPPILIIHLKRFQYNSVIRDKVDSLVQFPIEGLDMSKWIVNEETKEDAIYDLYAVSHHYGGLGGGHYTATACHCLSGQWYHFDDSSVTRVEPQSCISPSAYILFYRRRGAKPPALLM